MLYSSYDPFTFMVILLFIYFILILFIVIIIYNIIHRDNTNSNTNSNQINTVPSTTCLTCIPKPTPLSGNKQFY